MGSGRAVSGKAKIKRWVWIGLLLDTLLSGGCGQGIPAEYLEAQAPSPDVLAEVLDADKEVLDADKEVLVLGTLFGGPAIREAVAQFNQTDSSYQVVITNYGEEDIIAGELRMNAELVGDRPPDIIDLLPFDMEELIGQGILADISPYMEQDSAFQPDDYLENILAIHERDGRSYGIMSSFYVNTMVGKEALLGGMTGWDLEGFLDFAQEHPDTPLFEGASCEYILGILLRPNMNRFIDWDAGVCYFNNEEFIRLLEYVAISGNPSQSGRATTVVTDGGYIRAQYLVNDAFRIMEAERLFEGDGVIIGYPTANGNGHLVTSTDDFGMHTNSQNKEGVWEFFRFLLSEDFQQRYRDGNALPVRRSVIEQICQAQLEGQQVGIDEAGNIHPESAIGMFDNIWAETYQATDDQVAEFMEIITSAQVILDYSKSIETIIMEEVDSYFTGQKTKKAVAELIQNRVGLYLMELI
ncbi:MAG: extracellular solute-binding protein [Lachnospiraceae bacterium]|jgi:ABC-type glycerol-3-phosphate transport system substrate-binding protein|nr:extracellular solute-binding protein [Lachnospiraceae bacterium]